MDLQLLCKTWDIQGETALIIAMQIVCKIFGDVDQRTKQRHMIAAFVPAVGLKLLLSMPC